MVKEFYYIIQEDFFKVIGNLDLDKDQDIKFINQKIYILAILNKVNHMVMENIYGNQDKFIKDNGKRD